MSSNLRPREFVSCEPSAAKCEAAKTCQGHILQNTKGSKRSEKGEGEAGVWPLSIQRGFHTLALLFHLLDFFSSGSNKCHASSNKCLTSSNKKLLETSALLVVTRSY